MIELEVLMHYIHSEEMEASMKYIFCILGCVMVLGIGGFIGVEGKGECGINSPDAEAMNLAPCTAAGKDENVGVSRSCCLEVKKLGQRPSCLCAVVFSDTVKNVGINPAVAMTIPKRCNLADRPVGYKCGAYTLP